MSTVLTVAGSPGRMPLAVRMAAPVLELTIDSEPVENVFDGFADDAVKFAPDPTATAVAQSRAASAPRRRLGLRESLSIRLPSLAAADPFGGAFEPAAELPRWVQRNPEASSFASPPHDGFAMFSSQLFTVISGATRPGYTANRRMFYWELAPRQARPGRPGLAQPR